MRLIKPYFEIIEQSSGLDGIYRQIEIAGRTCYKSEDKITEDSAKGFVDRMIKSGHNSTLEHSTVYLKSTELYVYMKYKDNPYTKINIVDSNDCYPIPTYYISTNYRVLVEKDWFDDLRYLCEPTEYHEKRVTVRFVCDRGVSHEFVRHRIFSFAQESTRYCNYSKSKFKEEITYILPPWVNIDEGFTMTAKYHCSGDIDFDSNYLDSFDDESFARSLAFSELTYFNLLDKGWTPQQARAVLPNALKTELVMTGFISDWKHFFSLRDAPSAHPQARELANPLHTEFISRGYL